MKSFFPAITITSVTVTCDATSDNLYIVFCYTFILCYISSFFCLINFCLELEGFLNPPPLSRSRPLPLWHHEPRPAIAASSILPTLFGCLILSIELLCSRRPPHLPMLTPQRWPSSPSGVPRTDGDPSSSGFESMASFFG